MHLHGAFLCVKGQALYVLNSRANSSFVRSYGTEVYTGACYTERRVNVEAIDSCCTVQ